MMSRVMDGMVMLVTMAMGAVVVVTSGMLMMTGI